MNTMTVRDFRTNLSASFDRVDAGERILVRRRNRVYTIVPVEDDDLIITPELQAKIDKARQEYKEGKTLRFESAEAVQKWMDEL
ncbi:MAG: type II toxin-antitoxin system Phd/YefM family antitoxin [Bacteroides sp.]|nr:type II toxin-antitoxin system Phd/YefM family antitoxin [Bacteroides sp.]